jgi:hypothetical protein
MKDPEIQSLNLEKCFLKNSLVLSKDETAEFRRYDEHIPYSHHTSVIGPLWQIESSQKKG